MKFKVLIILAITAFAFAECRWMSSESSEEEMERTANDLHIPMKSERDEYKSDSRAMEGYPGRTEGQSFPESVLSKNRQNPHDETEYSGMLKNQRASPRINGHGKDDHSKMRYPDQ